MARRIPLVHNGAKILIICEGYEEYDYLKRLKSLRVWDENFCIEVENAKSIFLSPKIGQKYKQN